MGSRPSVEEAREWLRRAGWSAVEESRTAPGGTAQYRVVVSDGVRSVAGCSPGRTPSKPPPSLRWPCSSAAQQAESLGAGQAGGEAEKILLHGRGRYNPRTSNLDELRGGSPVIADSPQARPSSRDFSNFFSVTSAGRYPYHERFASQPGLARLLRLPTGARKTAAAVLGWLWRRRYHPLAEVCRVTPRRLVYCLPRRVLVEQTRDEAVRWLSNLGLLAGQVE